MSDSDQPLLQRHPSLDAERLKNLAVSRDGLVFDPRSGLCFAVNATGLATLDILQRGASLQETAYSLSARYAVPLEVAKGAIEGFVRLLAKSLP